LSGAPDPKPKARPKRGLRARPKPPATEDEKAARQHFKLMVHVLDLRCLVHDDEHDCVGDRQAHHVVTQQQLRDAFRDDLLWDWRNGMTVCERAHSRHTKAVERIGLSRVPDRCVAFAEEHGFGHVLARYYDPTR
jgi:hypothetical protein